MKKLWYCLTVMSFASMLVLVSCQNKMAEPANVDLKEISSSANNYRVASDNQVVLGKKFENPYEVKVMQKAFETISSKTNSKVSSSKSPVRTTHHYVRFLPKDWKEYDALKADTSLILYDTPLDYEILLHGNKYHDASVCDTCPTWQYTALKIDKKLKIKIKQEKLSDLYIPETDSDLAKLNIKERVSGKSFLDALLDEAMIMTKNYSDTLNTKKTKGGKVAWNPSGTIRVFDTRLQTLIPLVGVEIRARRWFTTHIVSTDQNGFYYSPWGFDRPANYSLYFQTWAFDVRTGTFGQAWIDGPKQDSPWDLDIQDGVDRFYSHVFRGAYRYNFGDVGGLKRPYLVGFAIKYAAYDQSGQSQGVNIGNWSFFNINPNILIYRFNGGVEYNSDEIFSTTCHETCHTTHVLVMNAGYIQYSQIIPEIYESWPTAVEWFITQKEYQERGIGNYATPFYVVGAGFPIERGHQRWRYGINQNYYSCVFIDLIDNFNQAGQYQGFNTLTDNVTGYTMSGIESGFLKYVYGFSSLRDQLKANKPSGVTDAQIDEMINQY